MNYRQTKTVTQQLSDFLSSNQENSPKKGLKSIRHLMIYFPHFQNDKGDLISKKDLNLNSTESVFYDLCLFLKSPNTQHFDFRKVYENLRDEWVEITLEALELFSREDTFIINKPNYDIITEDQEEKRIYLDEGNDPLTKQNSQK